MLKVDLEYPDELHELHSNYPLAPEKHEISYNMLSKCYSNITNKYGMKRGVNYLVPNLGNKDKCVLHYRNLQLHLSLRMKMVKVYTILKFKQSDWLRKYTDFNTNKTKNVGNSSEKYFFKQITNSVYGIMVKQWKM